MWQVRIRGSIYRILFGSFIIPEKKNKPVLIFSYQLTRQRSFRVSIMEYKTQVQDRVKQNEVYKLLLLLLTVIDRHTDTI